MSQKAYIAIGTNLGDRARNYRTSLEKISELPDTRVTRTSSRYESEPHGRARNWFLNGVIEIETEIDSKELLKALQKIEKDLGRKRSQEKKSVSRIIDLDIILFDTETVESRNLKIPHPEMANRKFVLRPLAELVPGFLHPVTGVSVSVMLAGCKDDKQVVLYKEPS